MNIYNNLLKSIKIARSMNDHQMEDFFVNNFIKLAQNIDSNLDDKDIKIIQLQNTIRQWSDAYNKLNGQWNLAYSNLLNTYQATLNAPQPSSIVTPSANVSGQIDLELPQAGFIGIKQQNAPVLTTGLNLPNL